MNDQNKRADLIDVLRTIAICWMIIFHLAYDMKALGFSSTDFSSGFWYYFPRVIAGSFLFIVGLSLHLAYENKINWSKFWHRQMKIAAGAVIISLTTYFIFPANWVYFGTLHCIFFATLFGVFLVGKRIIIMVIFLLILGGISSGFDLFWISQIIRKPSMDFIPIYPWFLCTALGLFVASFEGFWKFVYKFRPHPLLTFPGKHSLIIYLLHQPIIFGTLILIKNLR